MLYAIMFLIIIISETEDKSFIVESSREELTLNEKKMRGINTFK
jgi:hypothetical protein